eukprot:593778-Pelagomonas_calceolata.AAC.2
MRSAEGISVSFKVSQGMNQHGAETLLRPNQSVTGVPGNHNAPGTTNTCTKNPELAQALASLRKGGPPEHTNTQHTRQMGSA